MARGDTVFIGRVRELGQLAGALEAARAGDGVAVSVAGEAGIGKTRLTSELARRARAEGFQVLVGRSIDLVGSELPYQAFIDALRPVGEPARFGESTGRSQLKVFEETLAMLSDRGAAAPVLLILEDLHWADVSTLDLVVFLAHNLAGRRILLMVTIRVEPESSSERMRRFVEGVRRSGAAIMLELGPLEREEMTALLAAHADAPMSAAVTNEIVARCEGNPFFAEELLAASGEGDGELPHGLRDLLLQRVARLDDRTRAALRVAAAAGREVGYPLLRATADLPDQEVRESLRRAVEHGVLVAELASGRFRFRHALLAEAIYTTILPGEREELHGRIADELARDQTAAPAELARHWAAAGRKAEALSASVQAAHQAQAVFGLAESHAHLERALELWPAVPDAAERAGIDLAGLLTSTAELASQVGAAARAIQLQRQAIELVSRDDPARAAFFHVRLGEYLYGTGNDDIAIGVLERAVELGTAAPRSREHAYALASLAGGLMVALRHGESVAMCERALALARDVGAGAAEVRALTALGVSLAYLGRGNEGVAQLRQARQLAEEIGDHWGLDRAFLNLTDVLTMLGRPRESVRVGEEGLEVLHRYGIYSPVLIANQIESLLAIGDWDAADQLSAAALRAITSSFPYALFIVRALLETDRGQFDAARAHLEAATETLRVDRGHGLYDGWVADLALWERRWADAETAIDGALVDSQHPGAAMVRVKVCATALRVCAELATLARARQDAQALGDQLERAETLLATAQNAAAEASAVTPNAAAWCAQAEAEYERARGVARADSWSRAAGTWDRLERPPLAAYCRWHQAEALIASGASRSEARVPLHAAYEVATRMKAAPLLRELELLAERARLDLTPPDTDSADRQHGVEHVLGLTSREVEVLALIARGYTNREIAEALVISVKTASVHVSHILAKLDAPNRREAAAIAHRLSPPPLAQHG